MTRTRKLAALPSAVETTPPLDTVELPMPADASPSLQHWMAAPLAAAEQASAWFERLQQHNLQTANLWWEALTMAALEADHADRLGALLSVPGHLLDRQAHLTTRCCADNLQDLQDLLVRGAGWLGRAQADWLAMTRSWART